MNCSKTIYYPFPLGVHYDGVQSVLRVSMEAQNHEAGVILYQKGKNRPGKKVILPVENRMGRVRFGEVKLEAGTEYSYTLFDGDREYTDKNALSYQKMGKYGVRKTERRAYFTIGDFDWEEDRLPMIPYEDAICYGLHVRGFTIHSSSGIKEKGTFAGLIHKKDYLKELGITTLVLQPAYEFEECMECTQAEERTGIEDALLLPKQERINYWGYCRGYYYAPKAAYSYEEDSTIEFRRMVKEFHQDNMEIVMQFYFPEEIDSTEIIDVLHFWAFYYHVDGFLLMGNHVPMKEIAKDPALIDRKLWYQDINTQEICENGKDCYYNLAEFREDYYYATRKFLKGESNSCYPFSEAFRRNWENKACINFLTDYQGFTLWDSVSYEYKHNEDNGENNRDGKEYNCSWNCGVEGSTRNKKVLKLRNQQVRNAMLLLMLSQGTPYFFMGDEFLRTQKGNNNPYCQDNGITWVNWKDLNKNQDFFQFVKELISFRKAHSILHEELPLPMIDRGNSGFPALSFHGENPWKPDFFGYQHHLGIMLFEERKEKKEFIYIAINQHWEKHTFSLPNLPKKYNWKPSLATTAIPEKMEDMYCLEPRSICVFVAGE